MKRVTISHASGLEFLSFFCFWLTLSYHLWTPHKLQMTTNTPSVVHLQPHRSLTDSPLDTTESQRDFVCGLENQKLMHSLFVITSKERRNAVCFITIIFTCEAKHRKKQNKMTTCLSKHWHSNRLRPASIDFLKPNKRK